MYKTYGIKYIVKTKFIIFAFKEYVAKWEAKREEQTIMVLSPKMAYCLASLA